MGFARLAEQSLRKTRGIAEHEKLGAMDKILASSIGGALGCWNQVRRSPLDAGLTVAQPIEVVRVEMQSMAKGAATAVNRPAKLTVFKCVRRPPTLTDHAQHPRLHLQRGRYPRALPWCAAAHRPRHLANRALRFRSHNRAHPRRSAWSRSLVRVGLWRVTLTGADYVRQWVAAGKVKK